MSNALGARGLSTEISVGQTKRLGQFADKHKMQVGYHGHAATTAAMWEAAFAEAKYNAANLDLGHFVAGNNTSPVPFIKQYHDRITHVHVKDRKLNNGANVPFGQGDTPIKEVLQLMRDNKWRFQATIEFEYPVPPGSDRMAEIAKAIANEPRLAQPTSGDATELNASLPPRFFELQSQLRAEARRLEVSARARDAAGTARSYGALAETCVSCHDAYLSAH